jgi:hypothetical protein
MSAIIIQGPMVHGGRPEASTWAMMVLGFGGIGFAGYWGAVGSNRLVRAMAAAAAGLRRSSGL